MANIEIIGGDKMVRSIAKRVDKSEVNNVVKRNTAQLQEKMMKNASFSQGYQTGFTKRSISIELFPMNLSGEVGPGSEYSPYLEWGTRYMDAQPFVRPSAREQRIIFVNDMKNLIKRG